MKRIRVVMGRDVLIRENFKYISLMFKSKWFESLIYDLQFIFIIFSLRPELFMCHDKKKYKHDCPKNTAMMTREQAEII